MTDNRTTELLPCPFCGGDEIIRSVDGGIPPDHCEVTERYVTTCTLYCDKCGAQVQRFGASNSSTNGLYRAAVDECYKAWNTRHERTCRDTGESRLFRCSECGFGIEDAYLANEGAYGLELDFVRFCPSCGRKVVNHD